MSFISYAQNYEDVLLKRALADVPAGFYIDVGANDPELHSVTKAFYDQGWRGINIEPMPSYRAAFLEQRPRDINLNAAAGAASGEITLFDIPAVNGWASTDAEVARGHRAEGYEVVEHRVPLLTLAEICRQHVQGEVHFLKVDVEGFEADVLRGMDFTLCRPWIVVVEAIMPNSRDSNHASWEALVTGHGYQFAWFDGLNRYYVADEHAALAERLRVQPNVFDDYITHHLDKAWQRGSALSKQADAAWDMARQQELSAQQAQARAAELEQSLMFVTGQLRQSEARAQSLEANLHQASEWGKEMEQTLLAVYASSSWRITAPLRAIMRRGERSLLNIARRRARGAVRRSARWISSRQWLRRALLPILARFPAVGQRVTRLLGVLKHGNIATEAGNVPHLQRELPQSARQVLADLQRAQQQYKAD
jgi:FkbM family methyltransferase